MRKNAGHRLGHKDFWTPDASQRQQRGITLHPIKRDRAPVYLDAHPGRARLPTPRRPPGDPGYARGPRGHPEDDQGSRRGECEQFRPHCLPGGIRLEFQEGGQRQTQGYAACQKQGKGHQEKEQVGRLSRPCMAQPHLRHARSERQDAPRQEAQDGRTRQYDEEHRKTEGRAQGIEGHYLSALLFCFCSDCFCSGWRRARRLALTSWSSWSSISRSASVTTSTKQESTARLSCSRRNMPIRCCAMCSRCSSGVNRAA